MSQSSEPLSTAIDISVPSVARMYDFLLGGKDNYAVDREASEELLKVVPSTKELAVNNRRFLQRVVARLAEDHGIRQFLDHGSGLPTQDNVHQVSQRVDPSSRVVYVDNDPIVITHARALLTGKPGTTDYVHADLRQPETILREAARTLDFGQPVAIVLLMILMHVSDEDRPHELVARLLDAVPSGSYLVISETANDVDEEVIQASQEQYNKRVTDTQWASRTSQTFARYFSGLEVVQPGLVTMGLWRPAPGVPIPPYPIPAYCGVARKP
jgi:hypothetical protein